MEPCHLGWGNLDIGPSKSWTSEHFTTLKPAEVAYAFLWIPIIHKDKAEAPLLQDSMCPHHHWIHKHWSLNILSMSNLISATCFWKTQPMKVDFQLLMMRMTRSPEWRAWRQNSCVSCLWWGWQDPQNEEHEDKIPVFLTCWLSSLSWIVCFLNLVHGQVDPTDSCNSNSAAQDSQRYLF
jgi:hypothetical protein